VRAQPVEQASNAVLHPWLQREVTAILEALPDLPTTEGDDRVSRACWEAWQEGLSVRFTLPADLPPLRMLLVWDNLTGHKTSELVCWLCAHGVMPLYTPLGGSWLNMAESIQRILVRRALEGQHPEHAPDVMDWLAATVRGWNAAPTPFVWGGKRAARRQRARERRHAQGGSGAYTRHTICRCRRATHSISKGDCHAN
jgi:hypothetical protein